MKITVSAPAGHGRHRMALLIAEALMEFGFMVDLDSEGPSKSQVGSAIERMNRVREKNPVIVVDSVQLPREASNV